MVDKIIKTYIDEEGIEITVVEDEKGNTFYCYDLEVPEEVAIMIRKEADKQKIPEWEIINNILTEYLEKENR